MPYDRKANAARGQRAKRKSPRPLRKRGPKPRPIVEFPEPLTHDWSDPPTFPESLSLHMARHGDSCFHLHRSIIRRGERFDRKTLRDWAAGCKTPNSVVSFDMLARVEHRYRLPTGYFRAKLEIVGRAPRRHDLASVPAAERRRLAWHLPCDFDKRPAAEQAEILDWVRSVVISGSTDYRRYQTEAMKVRYALRFPPLAKLQRGTRSADDDIHEADASGGAPAKKPLLEAESEQSVCAPICAPKRA